MQWWVASFLDFILIFFIKENWICAMTRYHAEPDTTSNIGNIVDNI